MIDIDFDYIREILIKQRKYASYFEWPEKNIKEVGVVETLIESQGLSDFRNLQAVKEDPPDCLAETGDGGLVGFEITELVCQESIERNQKGEDVYRDWENSEVVQELQKIIKKKDLKNYLGGPYEKLILVIHTAEPVLTHRELKPILDAHKFNQMRKLHEAYLLFEYDPGIQSCPYIRLKFLRE